MNLVRSISDIRNTACCVLEICVIREGLYLAFFAREAFSHT